MAKARPVSELSPAYARRLERERARAAAEGRAFDRKKARGKTADEAAQRKARKAEPPSGIPGDITPGQKAAITRYARIQGEIGGLTDDEVAEMIAAMRKHALFNGYKLTSEMMHAVRKREKGVIKEKANSTYKPKENLLAKWTSDYKVPDLYWLYYHR